MSKPPVDPIAYPLRCLRRAVEIGYPWSVSPHEARALVAEVERLRALEADAERARVKADLWSYYEAFVAANGAGSITELVVQRDAARAEAAEMRAWAERAAGAEHQNSRDLEAAGDILDCVREALAAANAEAIEMRAWAEEAAKAENENAEDARRERAAVLACLRVADDFSPYDEIATVIATIERGEHRREEQK